MDSGILLTYHSATIRAQDLISISPYQWLTDEVITFFLQYLEHSPSFPLDSILVCPSVAATLCLSDAEEHQDLYHQFSHLHLKSKRLFLCPINNGDGLSVESGEHWALLVGLRQNESSQLDFFYLDPIGGTSCLYQATKLSSALKALLFNNPSLWASQLSPRIIEEVPKQKNAYDCGIYTLIMVQRILKRKDHILKLCSEKEVKQGLGQISSGEANQFREQLKSLIAKKIKEME